MRITVFGSSCCAHHLPEYGAAWEIGRRLARRGVRVVNGARNGVMKAVSAGAAEEHGSVVGVMRSPKSFCNEFVTESIVCDPESVLSDELSLNIRTGRLLESDGFIVILGSTSGPGTYKELVAIIESELGSWNPKRPCAVLFVGSSYNFELATAFGISLKDQVFDSLMANDGYAGWLRIFLNVSDELISFATGELI